MGRESIRPARGKLSLLHCVPLGPGRVKFSRGQWMKHLPVLREPPLRRPPCPPPRSVPPPPPGTATADPERILPLYLLHYGTSPAKENIGGEGKVSPLGPPGEGKYWRRGKILALEGTFWR